MKKFLPVAVVIILATLSFSCGSTRSGMPERVGGLFGAKVEDGPCLETGAILFFFKDPTSNQMAPVPLEKGCRCSYKVAGIEYMPTSVFPPEVCEAWRVNKLKQDAEKAAKESTNEQSGGDTGSTEKL